MAYTSQVLTDDGSVHWPDLIIRTVVCHEASRRSPLICTAVICQSRTKSPESSSVSVCLQKGKELGHMLCSEPALAPQTSQQDHAACPLSGLRLQPSNTTVLFFKCQHLRAAVSHAIRSFHTVPFHLLSSLSTQMQFFA